MSYLIPDDPVIRNMERTGFPDGKEPKQPVCPVCGSECEYFYREDFTDNILGCENCITQEDAWEFSDSSDCIESY